MDLRIPKRACRMSALSVGFGHQDGGAVYPFCKSDELDKAATEKQLARYCAFREACEAAGVKFQIHHCSNSAGIIDLPEANLDMVRRVLRYTVCILPTR